MTRQLRLSLRRTIATLASALLASGLAVCTPAMAESMPEFLPAANSSGPSSLLTLVQFPQDTDVGSYDAVVFCKTEIKTSGKTARTYCFPNKRAGKQHCLAAEKAVRESVFRPASVDTVPIPVHVSLRVIFQCQNDTCRIVYVPNLGFQSKDFGPAYRAPQEIVSKGNCSARYDTRLGLDSVNEFAGIMFIMSAAVDVSGSVSDPKIEYDGFSKKLERKVAMQSISNSDFIPGFVDEEAVAMRAFDFLYYRKPGRCSISATGS